MYTDNQNGLLKFTGPYRVVTTDKTSYENYKIGKFEGFSQIHSKTNFFQSNVLIEKSDAQEGDANKTNPFK